jgi:hypothetical protein
MPWPTGQKHHKSKLTDDDVRLIRELREQFNLSYRTIANKFESSMWTVRDICQYRSRYAR